MGWPLIWAHNPAVSLWKCGPATVNCSFDHAFTKSGNAAVPDFTKEGDAANERLLDPVVLQQVPHGHNLTGTHRFLLADYTFRKSWFEIAESGYGANERQEPINRIWNH